MSTEIISNGQNFLVKRLDRKFGGKRSDAFKIDGTTGAVTVGTVDVPSSLTINGTTNFGASTLASLSVAGASSLKALTVTTLATTGKSTFTPAAQTARTASTEVVNFDVANSATQQWATGALTTQRETFVRKPTYAFVGASTITSAATFAIEGAPVAGTNATITNAYALWVQAGATRFDGNFGLNKTPVAQQTALGTTTGFTAATGTAVLAGSTFTGGTGASAYTIGDLVLALKNFGMLAA